jgi:hypothetical protein
LVSLFCHTYAYTQDEGLFSIKKFSYLLDSQAVKPKTQVNTIFANHHQSLKIWIVVLYFMGLNLSNRQIALELNLNESDVQLMTSKLRSGVVERQPDPKLSGEIELDEVYVTAGHKGNSEAVKKKTEKDAEES